MSAQDTPSEPPPSYESSTSKAAGKSSHLEVPSARNGISAAERRSMEDLHRPLPEGWVRSYDQESHHQFFVNTKVDPPKSMWHHPYDDEEYLATLSDSERAHVKRLNSSVSFSDIAAESSDEEGHHHGGGSNMAGPSSTTEKPKGVSKFGRKLKDRVTGSTHEEREKERQQRAQQEQQAYEMHQKYRQAMSKAIQTGEPQLLGKDKEGRDVYIESPNGPPAPNGAHGHNPYTSGPYANPNARFIRPDDPYAGRMDPYSGRMDAYGGARYQGSGMGRYPGGGMGPYSRPVGPYNRPYGYGYGGGYGLPLMMGGGLMGGMMLGGLMF